MIKYCKCIVCWAGLFFTISCACPAYAQRDSLKPFNPKNAHYEWPTSASHALTSTFAETRAGHFHAALDIKTWGQRGYPVYATRSGTLFRLAIGPTGYGKVIYLKHDDGSFSVYAHLLRFNRKLQHWADSLRFSNYSSSFDMRIDSMHIYVKQGEKIGLSGASGIGPPHLHFELRTPGNEPFNPLRTNLTVRDTRRPVFSRLAVEPLSINSRIEGQNNIFTRRVSRGNPDRFGTIRVSGAVGLAVDLFDKANGVHNSYAVYKLSMSIDGQRVFTSKVDQFSYKNTHQVDLDRVYSLLQKSGRGYQRLYISDGNTLPFYKTRGNRGRLHLPAGKHHITITASDYFGNERKAVLNLLVSKTPQHVMKYKNPPLKPYTNTIHPQKWRWHKNWVDIPEKAFRQLTIAPLFNPFPYSMFRDNNRFVGVNLKNNPQVYFSARQGDYFISRRVRPSARAYLTSPNKKAFAAFPKGCFYDTASVAIKIEPTATDRMRISMFPSNQPLAKSYQLSTVLDHSQQQDTTLSFYRYSVRNGKRQKIESHHKGDRLVASPSSLGTFIMMGDTIAPKLKRPRLHRRTDGQWLVYVPVRDKRSGIDYKKSRIFVNGTRGLTEYEPEDDRLVYYLPAFKPKAKNHVRVEARDREGNKTTRKWILRYDQ